MDRRTTFYLGCKPKKSITFFFHSAIPRDLSIPPLQRGRLSRADLLCFSTHIFLTSRRFLRAPSLGLSKQFQVDAVDLPGRSPHVEELFQDSTSTTTGTSCTLNAFPARSARPVSSSALFSSYDVEESSSGARSAVSVYKDLLGEEGHARIGEESHMSAEVFSASDPVDDLVTPYFSRSISSSSSAGSPSVTSSQRSLRLLFSLGGKDCTAATKASTHTPTSSSFITEKQSRCTKLAHGPDLNKSRTNSNHAEKKQVRNELKQNAVGQKVSSSNRNKGDNLIQQEPQARDHAEEADDRLSSRFLSLPEEDGDSSNEVEIWGGTVPIVPDDLCQSGSAMGERKSEGFFRRGRSKTEVHEEMEICCMRRPPRSSGSTLRDSGFDCDVNSTVRATNEEEEIFIDELIEDEVESMLFQYGEGGYPMGWQTEKFDIGQGGKKEKGIKRASVKGDNLASPLIDEVFPVTPLPEDPVIGEDISAFDQEALAVELQTVGDKLLSKRKK